MTNHYPAAFINALSEEGTKEEAIRFLQETWNELCEAREKISVLKKELSQALLKQGIS